MNFRAFVITLEKRSFIVRKHDVCTNALYKLDKRVDLSDLKISGGKTRILLWYLLLVQIS